MGSVLGAVDEKVRWGDAEQYVRLMCIDKYHLRNPSPYCQTPGHFFFFLVTFVSFTLSFYFNLKSLNSNVRLEARPPALCFTIYSNPP